MGRLGLVGLGLGPRGLSGLQFFHGAMIVALTGIDDALEALERGAGSGEGLARGGGLGFGTCFQKGVDGSLPQIGFDAAQAAEAPFVVDEGIDEETLVGIGRAIEFVVFGSEFGEILGGFGEHDLLFGVDAVLQSVEAGVGLALGGDGAAGFRCVGDA